MKILFCIAALIFSATNFSVYSQSSTPTPTPTPAPSISPVPAADPQSNVPPAYVRPDPKTRFKRYVNGMFGPETLVRAVGRSGISTWQNSPEEWGGQWEGFGKRLASSLGKNVIARTISYGMDEALKLDSHYYRSKKKDVGSKIKNAVISPVTARNSRGKRVIGIPRIVGSYTSSIVAAETWYPDRYDWKDGVRNGTYSFGLSVAFNLFKEFVWKK